MFAIKRLLETHNITGADPGFGVGGAKMGFRGISACCAKTMHSLNASKR